MACSVIVTILVGNLFVNRECQLFISVLDVP